MPAFLLDVLECQKNGPDLDRDAMCFKKDTYVVLSADLHAAFAVMQKACPNGEISLSIVTPDPKRLDVMLLVKNKPRLYE